MKTFVEWLTLLEGMSVYVSGYNYAADISNIDDIALTLKRKIIDPMWQKAPKDEQDAVRDGGSPSHGIISPDGSYYTSGESILNLYTQGWSEDSIRKIIQGIKFILDEMKIKYGPFKQEKSNMFGSGVIRIPILQYNKTKNVPPMMHMSNSTAYIVFGHSLGIVKDGDGGGFTVSARELLTKIPDAIKKAWIHAREPFSQQIKGGATFFDGGLREEKLKENLEQLYKIAKWAIENNYDTIHVA